MVLAEVPLWVLHGKADAAGSGPGGGGASGPSSSGMVLPGGITPLSEGGRPNPPGGIGSGSAVASSGGIADHSRAAAEGALSLLRSTRGGSNRAPMYSLDFHPDGTRFATAGGDGAVRIWRAGALFGGKAGGVAPTPSKNGAGMAGAKASKNKRGGKGSGGRSRFTDGGNYVSSTSEDCVEDEDDDEGCDASSDRDGDGNGAENGTGGSGGGSAGGGIGYVGGIPSANATRKTDGGAASVSGGAAGSAFGVNDLSGLVRRKKGGGAPPPPRSPTKVPTPALPSAGPPPATSGPNGGGVGMKEEDLRPSPSSSHASPKLLSSLTSHEGSVLSVRWSPSGTYLASAGDDSYVFLYARSKAPSIASRGNLVGVDAHGNRAVGMDGGGGECGDGGGDVEHWNRVAVCRGHNLDVVGLAWAPDDSHLVSCSLDSVHPVVVWKLYDVLPMGDNNSDEGNCSGGGDEFGSSGYGSPARGGGVSGSNPGRAATGVMHTLHPHKVLGRDAHTSTVKGVAFDPAGKYIATSGDDPAVCIWRAFDDWGLEARIDSTSGIFRSKKRRVVRRSNAASSSGGSGGEDENSNHDQGGRGEEGGEEGGDMEMEEDDPGELASLSLFRRISFAPDGSHVCGTNATLRGKNIAAMISREGWAASAPNPVPPPARSPGSDDDDGGSSDDRRKSLSRRHPPGAANLVGHKQPVVSSRHCPVFFEAGDKTKRKNKMKKSDDDDDPDAEPDYATLVALGDKRGFVTVWSTKSSRPLFKMQCSESRCTVTDISWGWIGGSGSGDGGGENGSSPSLAMIVSLLDGYVVALRFSVPFEVGGGSVLSARKCRRIFQLRYGIDSGGGCALSSPDGRRKRLVDNAGPALIENALQLTMEMDGAEDDIGGGEKGGGVDESSSSASSDGEGDRTTRNLVDMQEERVSSKTGKKRIRPVSLNAAAANTNSGGISAGGGIEDPSGITDDGKKKRKKSASIDLLQDAMDTASRAASAAEGVIGQKAAAASSTGGDAPRSGRNDRGGSIGGGDRAGLLPRRSLPSAPTAGVAPMTAAGSGFFASRIPFRACKVHTTDLPARREVYRAGMHFAGGAGERLVADCANSAQPSSFGCSSGTIAVSSPPCAHLTISRGGVRTWKDVIAKTTCTALAANPDFLAAGTSDGCLYLYRTSPTVGWECGKAFRAYPPFVFGSPIVEINFGRGSKETKNEAVSADAKDMSSCSSLAEIIVVTSDGTFGVYRLMPDAPKLLYKGSIVPPIQHMFLSSSATANNNPRGGSSTSATQPKLVRIQITQSNHLMMILSHSQQQRGGVAAGCGRSLQGFVYNRDMQLWMRVSDSTRFLLSDFYISTPSRSANRHGSGGTEGVLAQIDEDVRSGSGGAVSASAKRMYQRIVECEKSSFPTLVTRAHCEDRMACALAMGSPTAFERWLSLYARRLSSDGDTGCLRFIVDVILGNAYAPDDDAREGGADEERSRWWLDSAIGSSSLAVFDGRDLVRRAILPEMSKNRLLQRLMNEIAMELNS